MSRPRLLVLRTAGLALLIPLLLGGPLACKRDPDQATGAQTSAPLLLAEDFTEAGSLEGWRQEVGAHTAPGPSSAVSWDAGAVRLSGTAETRSWTSLERTVEVGDALGVTLRGRMRTASVDPSAARFVNCNLYLKHPGGIVGTRLLLGTQPWTEVRRFVPLPPGTHAVTVGLLLSLPGTAWFDDVRLERRAPPRWRSEVDGPYRYHWLEGDAIDARARAHNAGSYRVLSAFLGVQAEGPIDYWKYPDLRTKEELSGQAGNAHRTGSHLHTLFATDRHETVHVLADRWGDPPALLAEGLAVHLSGSWQRQPVRTAARQLVEQDRWIAPTMLLGSAELRARPDLVSYAVAGAFVEWVIARHGKPVLAQLYRQLQNRSPVEQNRQSLEQILGAPAAEIDGRVKAWLLAPPVVP